MKKILSLILVCFMLTALVAGCGSSEEPDSISRPPAGAQTQDETPQDNNNDVPQDSDASAEENKVLWINGTHAILTLLNGGDVKIFGGFEPSPAIQAEWLHSLEAAWDITDRDDLVYMIDTLTLGRHNPRFIEEVKYYELDDITEEELYNELMFLDDEEEIMFFAMLFNAYDMFGENAIMGWDLSRAAQLCAQGYLAGFLSYEEALERALAVGKVIQQIFVSWDDFWESYFIGYYWWSKDLDGLFERLDIYGDLEAIPNSPLKLNWNLDLG